MPHPEKWPGPVGSPREKWIYERTAHYLRKAWAVPDAIDQAIADRNALEMTLSPDEAASITEGALAVADAITSRRRPRTGRAD